MFACCVFSSVQEVVSLIAKEQQTLASESARKFSWDKFSFVHASLQNWLYLPIWVVQWCMILWKPLCCWLCGKEILLHAHFFFVPFAQELLTNYFLLLLLLLLLAGPWERMSSYSIITIVHLTVTYYSWTCKSFLCVNCLTFGNALTFLYHYFKCIIIFSPAQLLHPLCDVTVKCILVKKLVTKTINHYWLEMLLKLYISH